MYHCNLGLHPAGLLAWWRPHAMCMLLSTIVWLFVWMQASGNHEIDIQPDGRMFTAYNARYPGPQDPTTLNTAPVDYWSDRSDNNLYSAYTVPGFATVVRSSLVQAHVSANTPAMHVCRLDTHLCAHAC